MKTFESLVQECDADIRAGRPQEVSKRFLQLILTQVPREWRLPLANICRRAGIYSTGIRLLSPLVDTQVAVGGPTDSELAEYSVLLLRIGATTEALQKLDQVDTVKAPEALLFRAFCHFSVWQFEQAIPELQAYLLAEHAPYARLVGQVNLAYAYVECGMHREALELLGEIIPICDLCEYRRLQSNCRAMRAKVFLQESRYAEAEQELDIARQLFNSPNTSDQLFITKWRLILNAIKRQSTNPTDELRQIAYQSRDWEAMREADLFSLKVKMEKVRFLHLVFGTPFLSYRNRICTELGGLPDRSIYVLGPKSSPRMDLRTGEINGIQTLTPGRKCHQLIEILLRDFYSPLRIGGLFLELFPGEYFNISSSPDRVHQIIRRTRRWLEEEKIPVQIVENHGFYSVQITGEFSFRVPLERQSVESMNLHFERLKTAFGEGVEFSARSAKEKLGVSRRTIQRLVNWGISSGKIERLGPKMASQYRISTGYGGKTKVA